MVIFQAHWAHEQFVSLWSSTEHFNIHKVMVEPPPAPDAGCKLLDGFAIVIQFLLASTALLTLVIKRAREKPQRPLNIWYVATFFSSCVA